jgi:serine/threonine protein kinase
MLAGVIGHFRIESEIGRGGMGVVYKAIDLRLRRAVAIKTLNEQSLLDHAHMERLRQEAIAIASIDHPYICKVYDLLEHEGT